MGANSKIEWTHATFNPHWGCTRVSPGCENCYAEAFAKRVGHRVWGLMAGRREFGDKHWAEPLKWNAAAEKAGERRRVFCASMADVFEEHPVAERSRARLWPLIDRTPWLDWLLLTKRPQNIADMVPWGHGRDVPPANVWLGTSVEDQKRAEERIPHLLRVPAAVRFLSCEPLLGPVDLSRLSDDEVGAKWNALKMGIDWVIIGGESGPGARPLLIASTRLLLQQCQASGIAVHVKQLGAKPILLHLSDPKGGDWDEWPEDLRVRQYPTPKR